MLEKMGHIPSVAPNGKEAIAMLESESFDLVFMDVQMPEMDGLTATRTIRETEKKDGAHIPIVAMTAHAMKGDRERCLEAGMDGYITKPVTSLGISDTISQMFDENLLAEKTFDDQKIEAEGLEEKARTGNPSPVPAPAVSSFRWDRSKALQQVDGDESLLRELVQIFVEEVPRQLDTLQQAITASDFETIERTAHSLKGELSCLGLTEVAKKASDLEGLGRAREGQPPAELYRAFSAELSDVTSAMRDMLEATSLP
jgi:two-component system, sensor histidine kinase and response regulator